MLGDDLVFDLAQTVLAEEDLVADEEGGRAEGAAREAVAGLSTAQVSAQFAQLLGSLRQRSAA